MEIRAAVIGCGNISKFHFEAIEAYGAQVVLVCDLNETTGLYWAARTGSRFTKDYMDCILDASVNVIHITLVSSMHRVIAERALKAGKHVICEKTLSESSSDSLAITRLAVRSNLRLYTSYMKRFIPAFQMARERVKDIGKIISGRIFTYQSWGDNWTEGASDPFFTKPEGKPSEVMSRYGGGILHCGGSHMLDTMCFLLGLPETVYAQLYTPPYLDYELSAQCLFGYREATVQLEALAHPLDTIGFLSDGWHEGVELTGTRGRIEIFSAKWDEPLTKASRLVITLIGEEPEILDFDAQSPFNRAVASFYDEISSGKPVQTVQSPWSGFAVDTLIDKIIMSDKRQARIVLDWDLLPEEGVS